MKSILLATLILCSALCKAQGGVYPYSDGKKWGLTNKNLDILITPQFDTSFFYSDTSFAMVQKDKKFGTINREGKILLPLVYDEIMILNASRAIGKLKGKSIFLNPKTGKQISALSFDKTGYYSGDFMPVSNAGKWGFFNIVSGKIVGQLKYDEVQFIYVPNITGKVRMGSKFGAIELKSGVELLPAKYDEIQDDYYQNKPVLAAVMDGKKKYFTGQGKEIVPGKKPANGEKEILEETVMAEEVAPQEPSNSKRELYIYDQGNGNWKLTIENREYNSTQVLETYEMKGYSHLEILNYLPYNKSRSRIKATKDGKTGIINLTEEMLVPFAYDDIEYIGLYYQTTKNGKVGMINMGLQELINPVLKSIRGEEYKVKAWLVEMPGGQQGYMDQNNGKIYIPGIE